jgi:outer membrane immunogenic protein
MKNLLLGSVALIVCVGAAKAADLPRMPVKAPPVPVVSYDWNGFYLGGYYGDSLGNQKGSTDPTAIGGRTGVTNVNQIATTLGLTAGYNWQFAPHWLVGLEGDIGYLGINRTNIEFNDITLVGHKADWYGTARARFGYVTGPSVLYVTGGAAFVHTRDTFGGNLTTVGPTTSTSTITSWTAGGGIETKISRAWSAKTEYLFIDGGNTVNFLANPRGIANVPSSFDHNYHVMKAGLNYQFGGANDEGFFAFLTAGPMPSDHNWSGFYAGVNVGGGMSLVNAPAMDTIGTTQLNGTGFAGGGQVGYNWMNVFGPKWFVGVEGDIGALRIRASMNDWFDTASQFTENTSWYATARGRVGTTTGPALLYFTAGGAWVNFSDGFAPVGVVTGDLSSRTHGGWTVGGGTEVALDSRWSAKLESLYIDVGHTNHQNFPPSTFGADFKERFQVVRFGLNYKFGADDVFRRGY